MTHTSEISAAPGLAPSPISRVLANRSLRDSTLLIVLAGIWIFFYFATNGTFLTQRNLILLALQTAIVALAAISAVMLIVTRNFDLSVGSAVALIGVIVALLTVRYDVDPGLAVIICLMCGGADGRMAGLVGDAHEGLVLHRHARRHALLPRHFDDRDERRDGRSVAAEPQAGCDGFLPPVPSIAVILAALGLFAVLRTLELRRGVSLGVVKNFNADLLRALLPSVVAAIAAIWLASSKGIPYLIVLVAACAIAADILMRRTRFGAQLYAIGGNPEAARLSGINVDRVIFINFAIAGLAYGITGVALTARVSGAIAGSAGLFLELDAIAAAIIGGTALNGGRGRVFGAMVGALLMGSLNNGMSLMNVPTFYQDTARGVVLLLAVALDQLSRRKSAVVR